MMLIMTIFSAWARDDLSIAVEIKVANNYTDVFLCIAQAGSIAAASAYIVISLPFICVVLYFLQKFYLRTSRQLRFMDLEAKSPL